MVSDNPRRGIHHMLQLPRSWLARTVLLLAVSALAVLAFFFVLIFLIVGVATAAGLLVRWWWLVRSARQVHRAGSIEGEYVIVKSDDDASATAQLKSTAPMDGVSILRAERGRRDDDLRRHCYTSAHCVPTPISRNCQ